MTTATWEVWQFGKVVATVSGELGESLREALHHANTFGEAADVKVTLRILDGIRIEYSGVAPVVHDSILTEN